MYQVFDQLTFQAQPRRMGGSRSGTSWSRSTASRPRTWRTGTLSSWSRLAARQSGSSSGALRRPTLPSLVSDPHHSWALGSFLNMFVFRPGRPLPHHTHPGPDDAPRLVTVAARPGARASVALLPPLPALLRSPADHAAARAPVHRPLGILVTRQWDIGNIWWPEQCDNKQTSGLLQCLIIDCDLYKTRSYFLKCPRKWSFFSEGLLNFYIWRSF